MNPSKLVLALLLMPIALVAAEEPKVISLWPEGAPGFADRRNEPEQAKDYWVRNIHNPSITAFLPAKGSANGAAVVICPGGGHRELVFKAEGVEPACYLTNLGVAAFVLKYRLGREQGSPYSIQKHALEDGQRAMRLVRSRAKEWGIDSDRIGIMGFSAGGEVASMVCYAPGEGNPNAPDLVEQMSCRPNFQVMIYPGPIGIPDVIPTNSPPAFFLAAYDDQGPSRTIAAVLPKYREAKIPVEVHLFARGGHAFNMGNRSQLNTLKTWPQRMTDWMTDNNFLVPSPKPELKTTDSK